MRMRAIPQHILKAIRLEIAATPKYHDFVVRKAQREAQCWKVLVDLDLSSTTGLDESHEGSTACWGEGNAVVLSVDQEKEQLNLHSATAPPPEFGGSIRVYPPRYLDYLAKCWADPEWAQTCVEWLESVQSGTPCGVGRVPHPRDFPWLRTRQQEAFNLPAWPASFLWGPPGTGKTTTLGALLASYLVQFPGTRILLFSTTNTAVDQALVATDKALAEMGRFTMPVRKRCHRWGSYFSASRYKGREHLLPGADAALIERLAELEFTRPDKQDIAAYGVWKCAVEFVRSEIKAQAAANRVLPRLAALTTTRGVFNFHEQHQAGEFDLVVFEEASQVSMAHALALAPLGRCALFGGDPLQLAPIVRSKQRLARRWMGQSMFSIMAEASPSTCFLDEQSRMTEPICRVVSEVFYSGRLKVAADCGTKSEWVQARSVHRLPFVKAKSAAVIPVASPHVWSATYRGPIRYESAHLLCKLVQEVCRVVPQRDVIVLTPFRAQRSVISALLGRAGLKRVLVSTVHRAQGSERHTVFFDPVAGAHDFLLGEDAKRLINVAISRAKARLVLLLSRADLANPILRLIANRIEQAQSAKPGHPSIADFVGRPDFPGCLVDQVVKHRFTTGRVSKVVGNGRYAIILEAETGLRVRVNLEGTESQRSAGSPGSTPQIRKQTCIRE